MIALRPLKITATLDHAQRFQPVAAFAQNSEGPGISSETSMYRDVIPAWVEESRSWPEQIGLMQCPAARDFVGIDPECLEVVASV